VPWLRQLGSDVPRQQIVAPVNRRIYAHTTLLSLRVELDFGIRASIAKMPRVFGVEHPDSPGIPEAGREHS
jgi:hypothetical protein